MKTSLDTEFVYAAQVFRETTLRPPAPTRTLLLTTVWMLGSVGALLYASAVGSQLDSISMIMATASLLCSIVVNLSLIGNILSNRVSYPNTTTLTRHKISVTAPVSRIECPLTDCCWYTTQDYTIVQMATGEDIACGFSPRAKEALCVFLESCDIRRLPSRSLAFSLVRVSVGMTIGALAGLATYRMLWLLRFAPQSLHFWLYWGAILGLYLGWWHANMPCHWRAYKRRCLSEIFIYTAWCVFAASVFLALAIPAAPMQFGFLAVSAIGTGAVLTGYQRWRYRAFDPFKRKG